VRSAVQILSAERQRQRLLAWLLGVFAAVALTLAAVGLYGVMSYTVRSQTRELALRFALGAGRGRVLRLVASRAVASVLAGAAVGVAVSLVLGRLLEGLLYGVPAGDPLTLTAAVGVLLAAVVAACWLPARRAARVSPMEALREV
jgi:ABC-type antimicrobial peptide transport system permease subunit